MPIGQTRHFDKSSSISPQRRLIGIGTEHCLIGIPDKLAAAMGPQVHHGRPATGHRHHVTRDLLKHRAFTRLRTDLHPGHPFAAFHLGNAAA